ncbi:MAG TPA: adenylosuccinate synthetase, partial [Solirubrobacteraceae bacterium]
NSMTSLVITKLDVLSGLEKIYVCSSYLGAEGAVFDDFPYHQTVLHHSSAQLTELPGWEEDLSECRTIADLPAAARDYLDLIGEHTGAPVALVGVGPGREQVIWTDAGRQTLMGAAATSGRALA